MALFVLNTGLGIVNQQLLNGDIQDLDAIRIRKTPNGVGVLAYDGSNFNSYLFEINQTGQSLTRKQFMDGNRAIQFVDDICYILSTNKYVFSGGFMRSDTLKAGADYVMTLGSCDLNLNADSIRFTSFFPTTGSPLKRAAVINERPSSLIRIDDSSFYLFANGKDFPHILHNPFRVDQISVSRWSGDLTLLTHEMYGRSDSADLMLYGNVSKDFQGNIWLGFVSENPIGSEWHYSRGEIGFMKFNGTGIKLDEFYIRKTDMRLTPRTVMCFRDSNILIGGSYYDFTGNRPLGSLDAFLMVVNPFRLWSATEHLVNNQLTINVYPNPTEGHVNFDISEDITSIQVKDTQGKLLLKSVIKEVDLSQFPPGMYIYELRTQSGKISIGKLIRR